MATAAETFGARTQAPPAEWALLPSYDGEQGTLWQVWMRDRGAAYWLMKGAVWLVNYVGRTEAKWRGREWEEVTNPQALEDGGIFETKEKAEDLCRIVRQATHGRKAATISPVVIGRTYPIKRVKAAGDFDPFQTFDFSATEAVKEQASRVLVDAEELEGLRQARERVQRLSERMRAAL